MDNELDLSRGILCIATLLKELDSKIEKDTLPFYDRPRFIYRGIHRYYDDNNTSNSNTGSIVGGNNIQEGYIRSALAIRLLQTANKNKEIGYIKVNYINVLQNMIRDVKRHYPEKYPDEMKDLDILADIQHNGGATCLVDFSKNFLTALWFACCDQDEYDGYIYCYDIMADMIKNNALTYLKEIDEKKDINTLLSQTYKHTNITSDIESRFWLWEPSARNSRIMRQDSIFIFGLEKFKVSDHNIQILRISRDDKKHILFALRTLFNITCKTIYNDSVGYAASNDKLRLIDKLAVSPYHRGYHNMIKGNFDSAADLLKLWEGENYNKLSYEAKVELHFSLAVCFKNLYRNNNVHYFENAIIEYRNCIRAIYKVFRKNASCQGFDSDYYCKKASRSYNSIIDILYEEKKYDKAIKMCNTILQEMESGIFRTYEIKHKDGYKQKLNNVICKLTRIELFLLKTISSYKKELTPIEKSSVRKELTEYEEALDKTQMTHFELFLLDYYNYLFEVLLSKDGKAEDCLSKMLNWRGLMETCQIIYQGYNFWNFRDIKKCIDDLDTKQIEDVNISSKKYNLQNITAHAISFRDIYEMQSVGKNSEV